MAEILAWVRLIVAAGLSLFGVFVILTGIWGVFRFRFSLNRMHTAAMVDSLGVLSLALGLAVAAGWQPALLLKLLLLVVFLWLSSPLCSHMVAKLETWTNDALEDHMEIIDLTTEPANPPEKEGKA